MHRILSVLFVLGLLLTTTTVRAAEQISALPAVAPVDSFAVDFVVAINKEPLGYGKGQFSGDRAYIVTVDTEGNNIAEIIIIGNTIYVRENNEQRWVSTTIDEDDTVAPTTPTLRPSDLTLWRVGDADVNGNATTQYQIQVNPSALGSSGITGLKVDLFIGKAINYLYKDQLTLNANDPQAGAVELEAVSVYSAFNQPFVINPPPAELVDQVRASALTGRHSFVGASKFPVWMRPLVVNRFATIGVAR